MPLATRLPEDLTRTLSRVCETLGLRKNFVIESALREKTEELLDASELNLAVRNATGFHDWQKVKAAPRRPRR
ncbi:MAG: hypothetical protein FD180_3350 [Planctomycetota bacterium]|nr:MAG: hypothetical protein FD180_3350 [Planctomycetota bacterium]